MSKKDYRKTITYSTPAVEKTDEGVKITFLGTNTNGTKIKSAVEIYRCHLPHLVKEFVRIATDDHTCTAAFLKRLKSAAI